MFAHIGVKAEHGEVYVRVKTMLVEEVQRENRRMRGVTTRQGEAPVCKIKEGTNRRIGLRDEHRRKVYIGVPHRQHLAHAERHYRTPDGRYTRETCEVRVVIRALRELYADEPVAVGGEVLEMTADNFRQCLARARRDLHSFMNGQCGLVNKDNPCRCPKKTRGFIADKEGGEAVAQLRQQAALDASLGVWRMLVLRGRRTVVQVRKLVNVGCSLRHEQA